MATTEIPDAAIRATATATAMAFRPIEGARPPEGPGWGRAFYEPSPFDAAPGPARRPVLHVGQEAAATMGIAPTIGRRRAETMPGGMIPVVDPPVPFSSAPTPAPAPPQPAPSPPTVPMPVAVNVPEHGRLFIDHNINGSPAMSVSAPGGAGTHLDLTTIAGLSRIARDDDDAVFGFTTGEDIAMDLD